MHRSRFAKLLIFSNIYSIFFLNIAEALETKNDVKSPFNSDPLEKGLKIIPKIDNETLKLSVNENKNPFSSTLSNDLGSSESVSGIKFSGVARVNEIETAFIETSKGLEVFKIGDTIGNGFEIIEINHSPAKVKISNGSITKTINLKE
mgnify:CR=1 FL=1